jgi:hypothetical protein
MDEHFTPSSSPTSVSGGIELRHVTVTEEVGGDAARKLFSEDGGSGEVNYNARSLVEKLRRSLAQVGAVVMPIRDNANMSRPTEITWVGQKLWSRKGLQP